MGFFKKLFSKKKVQEHDSELDVSTQTGALGDAERIANLVSSGLDSGNYEQMIQNLAKLTRNAKERTVFVFEHPSVIGNFCAISICLLFSMAFLYSLFIGICTACFSQELQTMGIILAVLSASVLILNSTIIARCISTIRFKSRFDVYKDLLKYKNIEFIEDIAINSKQNSNVVVSDFRKAVKQRLIPQGHFSNENCVFMVADRIYQRYSEKPAGYDRHFRQLLEERRIKPRTKEIDQLLDASEQYIQKLQGYASIIKSMAFSDKIAKMGSLVVKISHEIDVFPSQAQSLGTFLNYYLSTTEKLLDAYISIEQKKVELANIAKTKREIETAVFTLTSAFERILVELYEEQEMDILSDIDAVN